MGGSHPARDDYGWTSLVSAARRAKLPEKQNMAESVYKVIELIGTSTESWEKAAAAAVETASQSLRDLRIAEIAELDMQLEDGKVRAYRARVRVSFKFNKE
jgi:flavin-binding protein dodecin